MPVSKHRKKGQKKAVKRPGRALKEPPIHRQERLLDELAYAAIGAGDLSDDDVELAGFVILLVLEEVLAENVDGSRLVSCIGSRAAVIDAFCAGFGSEFGDVPGFETLETRRAVAAEWLDRLRSGGFLHTEDDQITLAVPVPRVAG